MSLANPEAMLFRFFYCPGCGLAASQIICRPCIESLTQNPRVLRSPTSSLEGVAPAFFAFERALKLIRRWKSSGGSSLEKVLFRLSPELKKNLLELNFFAIVPIPQSKARSYRRGHCSALRVAQWYSRELNVPLVALLGLKDSQPKPQTGRNRFEREFSRNPFCIQTETNWTSPLMLNLKEKVDRGAEIRILIVDDLITSGSTFAKASSVIQELFPRARCWAGTLGYRPRHQNRSVWFRNEAQCAQGPETVRMNPSSG